MTTSIASPTPTSRSTISRASANPIRSASQVCAEKNRHAV
jgi:hypothetical protein